MGKVSVLTKGGRFFGEPSTQFDFECSLTPVKQTLLLDSLLRTVLKPLLNRQQELSDLKGRDAGLLLDEEMTPQEDRPQAEGELMFCTGSLPISETKTKPFKIALQSDFSRFEGSKSIVHSLQEIRSGALPDFVPWYEMGRIFPVDITLFRVALEKFSPHRSWSFFGVMPVVTSGVYIDCSKDKLCFRVTRLSKDQERKALFDWELASKIEQSVSEVVGQKVLELALKKE